MSFSRLQEARYELHQQELADLAFDRFRASADEGRGMEHIPTCPECLRPTILLEHEHTPQRKLFVIDEPERERTWLACEWCGAEIDPASISERAPRKPTGKAEPEGEWIRRMA